MTYHIDEGTFKVQPTEDRTVNVLTLPYPDGNGPPLQLIVTRDARLGGESLSDCLTRQIDLLARQMAGFKERARAAVNVGPAALPGVALEIDFKQNGQTVYQCLAAIEVPDRMKPAAGRMLMVVLSSAVPLNPTVRSLWHSLLAGFQPSSPPSAQAGAPEGTQPAGTAPAPTEG